MLDRELRPRWNIPGKAPLSQRSLSLQSPPFQTPNVSMQHLNASSSRSLAAALYRYEKERLHFATSIGELVNRDSTAESLMSDSTTLKLIKSLLTDDSATVRTAAINVVARLCEKSEANCLRLMDTAFLRDLISKTDISDRRSIRVAIFLIRAMAKHSANTARRLVDAGAIEFAARHIQAIPAIDEIPVMASWVLNYVVRHGAEFLEPMKCGDFLRTLNTNLDSRDRHLRRVAASTLSDIARMSSEWAHLMVEADIHTHLRHVVENAPEKLVHQDRRMIMQALNCLSQIAKHDEILARKVLELEILPAAFEWHHDAKLMRGVAILCGEISKHSPEIAQAIVDMGAIPYLVEYTSGAPSSDKVPGLMALGFLATLHETSATRILSLEAADILTNCLSDTRTALITDDGYDEYAQDQYYDQVGDPFIKASACWAIAQLALHSSKHTAIFLDIGALDRIVQVYANSQSVPAQSSVTTNIANEAKYAFKTLLQNVEEYDALEHIITRRLPVRLAKHVARRLIGLITRSGQARKQLVSSGGLGHLHYIARVSADGGSLKDRSAAHKLATALHQIDAVYPQEVVQYYK